MSSLFLPFPWCENQPTRQCRISCVYAGSPLYFMDRVQLANHQAFPPTHPKSGARPGSPAGPHIYLSVLPGQPCIFPIYSQSLLASRAERPIRGGKAIVLQINVFWCKGWEVKYKGKTTKSWRFFDYFLFIGLPLRLSERIEVFLVRPDSRMWKQSWKEKTSFFCGKKF